MKIIKILFSQCLALAVLASFNVYAADQSICHSGANVELYNDGSLKACRLKKDYDVNSIQCKNDNLASFYANGSLESCVLSKPTSIGMIKCKQNGLISFYIDGKLKSCMKPDN
jgi:antitoxin component YwqK of YwqJK toxin-antitoxin module